MGFTVRSGYAMCPWTPCTASRPLSEPRRPCLIVSPARSSLDGSPTTHQSIESASRSITRRVPSSAGPSSSLVTRNAIDPRGSGRRAVNRSQAVTIAARLPFMSAAPRPWRKPSRRTGSNGGVVQASSGPGGTTSVWPRNTNRGGSVPLRAQRLLTAPNGIGRVRNPSGRKCSASRA